MLTCQTGEFVTWRTRQCRMGWHSLRRYRSWEQQFVLTAVVFLLPEMLSAFLKYFWHTAWHLFFCQINYAASLFTLPSVASFYPGMSWSLKLARVGWLGPGELCQNIRLFLCVIPQARAVPAPHHRSELCFLCCVALKLDLPGRSAYGKMVGQTSLYLTQNGLGQKGPLEAM